jgi:hypothetical protein
MSWNPVAANKCFFRWGVAGSAMNWADLAAKSIFGKELGPNDYTTGGIDVSLYINIGSVGDVIVSVWYYEAASA